jgi:hypothetical protein
MTSAETRSWLASGLLVVAAGALAQPAGPPLADPPPRPVLAPTAWAAAATQAGLDPGAAVASADGQWWLVADRQQPRLLLLGADGRLQRDWVVASLDGRQRSRVAALQTSPARRSVVVALQDLAELWEISFDPQAEPIHDGLVHDYRMAEAIAKPGYLGLRRVPLEQPLQDFRIDPTGQLVLGVAAPGAVGGEALQVIHLAVRRRIARLALDGPPDLARLVFGSTDGRRWLAVALLGDGRPLWPCFDRGTWARLAPGPCVHP